MDKVYETANIVEKAIGKAHQIAARTFDKTIISIPETFRGVSFCFDDFPASAAENGAKILENYGARGTFYTCFGLLGGENQGGKLATLDQVLALNQNGHDIGCHTYDHINCSFTSARKAADSCQQNLKAASAHGLILEQFSYPQGGMSLGAKKIIKKHYKTARSGFLGINREQMDTYCLKSIPFYEKSAHKIYDSIDDVEKNGGWLIVFSHDISDRPSDHGVSQDAFNKLISYCVKKDVLIRTVGEMMQGIAIKHDV